MEPSKLPFILFKRWISAFDLQYSTGGCRGKYAFNTEKRDGFLKLMVLISLFFILFLNDKTFSQTLFSANSTGNWTTLAWTKSGTGTTATYPGQPGHESEIHDVAINGVGVLVTLNNNISTSVRNISITGASLAITSNALTMTGNLSGNGAVSFTNGRINIAGNNSSTGTFSGSNGTVNYNGAAQIVRGGIIYYDLIISGSGTKTLNGNISINHNLTVNSGILQTAGNNLSVTGTTTIFSGGVLTTNSNLGTKSFANMVLSGGTISSTSGSAVTMNISGNLLVNNNSVSTLTDITSSISGSTSIEAGAGLTFGGSKGSKTFAGLVTINGSWDNTVNEPVTLSNGLTFNGTTFISGISQYTFNTFFQNLSGTRPITFNGKINVVAPAVLNNRTTVTLKADLTGTGSWRNDNGSVLNWEVATVPGIAGFIVNTASNTVNFSLAGDQEIRTGTYYNLWTTISGNKSLNGNVTLNGNLQTGTGTTLDAGSGNYGITLRGSWQNDGTFNRRSGSVSFTGSGPQSLVKSSGSTEEFFNLIINTTGPLTSDVDLAVSNNLTMTNGVIIMPGKKLSLGNSVSDPGTLTYAMGWITGIFSRWVVPSDNNSDIIFPVGDGSFYRGMTVNFQNITAGGILDAGFISTPPSSGGLPLFEDIYYLNQLFPEGYWNIARDASFAITGTFDLGIVPSGFSTFPVDASTRIVSRVSGGDWTLNGSHIAGSSLKLERSGLGAFTNDYAVAFTEMCEATIRDCPSDVSVNALPGECYNNVLWTPPTISVPCPAYSLTSNYNPGDAFNVGTTQVVYILRNGAVETDFCTFNVLVNDNSTPVITCANDQTRNVDLNDCHYTVTGTEMDPVFTYNNCPFTITNDLTGSSSLGGTQIHAGITTVLWTISGLSGNSVSCSMDITVNDNIAPVIAPVSNRVENIGTGCSFTIPDYRLLTTVTDNCGSPVVNQVPVPGTVISGAGTSQTITISATDAFNNTSEITFSVILADDTPPVALCRNISRVLDASGNAFISAADINNGSADNCGIASINVNKTSFTCADVGPNNVTLTVTDATGNSATCMATLTIIDNLVPSIACPPALSRNTDTGFCTASVAVPDPVYNDNCTIAKLTWTMSGATTAASPASGINLAGTRIFNKGVTVVSYTAEDGSGNQNTCSFTVTVIDNENPVITCPANISRNTDAGLCTASVAVPVVTVSDNCAVSTLTWTMTGATVASSSPAGINQAGTAIFNTGITTVSFTVRDADGNQASCSFTVSITDNIAPVLVCPPAINSTCAVSGSPPYNNLAAFIAAGGSAADNCGVNPASFGLLNQVSDGLKCPETITRTYRIADMNGNITTCTQPVIIDDITNPVITGSLAQTITSGCTPLDVPAPVTTVAALETLGLNITDACTADADLTVTSSDNVSGTCPVIITRTYTIADGCGNTATADHIIHIEDKISPTAGDLPPIAVECIGDLPAPDIDIITDEADNCSIPPVVTFISDISDGKICPEKITRRYRVTDLCGNFTDIIQIITIQDVTAPVITGTLAGTDAEGCSAADAPPPETSVSALESLGLSISDNCTGDDLLAVTSNDVTSGTCPQVVTRTYTVTDVCGNGSTAVQIINITDTSIPSVTGCPGDILVNTDAGSCSAVVTWPAFMISDNCGPLSFTSSIPSGSQFPAGTTVVTLNLTDNCGNTASCSFNVIVNDAELPVIACPASIIRATDHLLSTASVIVPDAVFSDNCAVSQLTWVMTGASSANSPSSGINQIGTYTFNEGNTTVTMSVTDASGNITTCTFQVTIVPPEGLQGSIVSQVNVNCFGDATGSVIVTGAGGYGAYEYKLDAGVYQSSGTFGGLAAGNYIVTVRDEDNTEINVPVSITQPLAPFSAVLTTVKDVTCSGIANGSIDVTATGGTGPYVFSWNGTAGFTSSLEDIQNLNPGSYSLNVTDAYGCVTFTLDAVIGEPAPLVITIDSFSDFSGSGVSCNGGNNGSITSSATGGTGPYTFEWTGPSGFSSSSDDITDLVSGLYTAIITDAQGCSGTASVNLTEPSALAIEYTATEASCPDEADGSIELTISGGTQPYSTIWDNGTTATVREELLPGTYSVVVTDANNCPGSLDITVGVVGTEACLVIQQIITPNNDNFNDTWIIRNIDLFPDAEVQVFNRWGKRVYQSGNLLADPWDGTDGGKPVPTDSYHYILDLHNGSKTRQGVITVIR